MSSSLTFCKLIGTPFSTFTRTIALGLHYKGIPFEQLRTPPQSDLAFQHHPFGYLPSLVIESKSKDGKWFTLSESQAIARYIERVAPEPPLELSDAEAGELGVLEEKVFEMVSLIASFGFPALEGGVIKPYVKAIDEDKDPASVTPSKDDQGVVNAKQFLDKIESRMVPDAKFAFGSHPTWADFFLFPLLDDLRAIPAWEMIASEKMREWITNMDKLEAVFKTKPGTLSAGASP
ncbi:glutathione S-transferase [Coprinopsis cinerea AmutBmut pab1-1]|nr:glutathione S-transferase [Coprinopsis cinerea AmutBmut pab1-1]